LKWIHHAWVLSEDEVGIRFPSLTCWRETRGI
jgi:hypothetical protein